MKNIACFGEVLWDTFPDHKKIGGAPLNVAIRLKSLGHTISIISRIGQDLDGNEIYDFVKEKDININGIQVDDTLKTGIVNVVLNESGSASYDIPSPRAWDNIQVSPISRSITKSADAFIFGSLITRNNASKETLYVLLKLAKYKIFDVNLRAPYYAKDILVALMNKADFIKFNDDELFEISAMLGQESGPLEEIIQFIAGQTNTKTICVTKGKHGAVLFVNGKFYFNSGYYVTVVDTVGAGDTFLASLISKLLNEETPQKSINYACALGALVASKSGANPSISNHEIEQMMYSG
ncbi:carbohydrate kinase [Zobellia sp.]|nr:carbohydrate kinase [Zobellia sp.]